MTDFKAAEIKLLNALGSILYIGAGQADLLKSCLASGADKIILIEPNPDNAAHLKRQSKQHKNVSFLPLAVSAQNSPSQFNIFNMAPFSSLHKPTGLKSLFPSLRQLKTVDVDCINVADLLKKAVLGTKDNHVLILDVPSEAENIIRELIANDAILRFRHIFLCAPVLALYQGNSSGDAVLQMLGEQGYDQLSQDNDDPDIVQYHLKRSSLAVKLRDLSGTAEKLDRTLQITQKTLDETKAECDKLKKGSAAKDGEVEELQSKAADFENQLTALHNELYEMKCVRDKLATAKVAQEAELDKLSKDKSQKDDELNKLRAGQDSLNSELAKTKEALSETNAECGVLKQTLDQENKEKTIIQLQNANLVKTEMLRLETQLDIFRSLVSLGDV